MYVIDSPDLLGEVIEYAKGFRKLKDAQKELRKKVKESAARCKRKYGGVGIIKHSDSYYELRIGNERGYHLWGRLVINERFGVRCREVL